MVGVYNSGPDTTATIMSTDNNMFALDQFYPVLNDWQAIQIVIHHNIGDIAIHKAFARWQLDYLIGRHAVFGAANPQLFQCLLLR